MGRARKVEPPQEPPDDGPPFDPGDPIAPLIKAMLSAVDDNARLVGEVKAAGAEIAGHLAVEELPGAVDRLVMYRYRRLLVWISVVWLCALCVGFGAGWLARGGAPALTCEAQKGGGVACWYWLTPPGK
jgi:hypothetical protein